MAGFKAWMTSSTLIESVKQRAMIPIAQSTFTNERLLAFANEELKIGMLPTIMTLHEEFLLQDELIPLVDNTSRYDIPYRAIGGKLNDIVYQDSSSAMYEMTRLTPADRIWWQSGGGFFNQFGRFYFENSQVVLVPPVINAGGASLAVFYYIRPNELVEQDRIATITAISTSGTDTIITVDQVPDNIRADITDSTTQSNLVDFLQTKPGHKTYSFDFTLPAGSIDTTSLTFTIPTASLPLDEAGSLLLVVGDCIASQGECFIPQIPTDLHVVLAQRVACRCLEALGDTAGLTNAKVKLDEMNAMLNNLIDNRAESSPQKIINQHSVIKWGRYKRFLSVRL